MLNEQINSFGKGFVPIPVVDHSNPLFLPSYAFLTPLLVLPRATEKRCRFCPA